MTSAAIARVLTAVPSIAACGTSEPQDGSAARGSGEPALAGHGDA
jgi:hypothetical protein